MYSLSFFNQSVSDAIEALPNGVRASFLKIAQRMEMDGPDLGMPYTKAMVLGVCFIAHCKVGVLCSCMC
jgi:hypothetical protein